MDRQGLGETRPRDAGARPADPLRDASTKELVTQLVQKASLLARKEVELAKAELKADVRSQIKMASGLGVAGVCGLMTLQLLLTALVFGLYEAGIMAGWAAALVVAAVVLAVGTGAGLWGWAKRVTKPLDTTRRSLRDSVKLAKERLA